jgi:hypothetical protein
MAVRLPTYWWQEVLKSCFEFNPSKVIAISIKAITGLRYQKQEAEWKLLHIVFSVVL